MSDAPLEVTLRPDSEQYRAWLRHPDPINLLLVAVLVGGALAAAVAMGSGLRIVGVALLVGLGVAIGLGGVTVSMRTSSVHLGDGTIEHRRWFVRRTVLSVEDGLRGLLAHYTPPVTQRGSDLLVIQRADATGPILRLNGVFWRDEDLVLIAGRAGVPVESAQLRARHYEKRLPGIMRPWERHWIAYVTLGPLAFLAVILGLLFVAENRGWLPEPSVSDRVVQEQDDTRARLMATIDAPWTTDADVANCTDGDGNYRTASARARLPRDSAILGNPEPTVARITAVLDDEMYQDVRPTVDGDEFYVMGRLPDKGIKPPRVVVSLSGGVVMIEVVSGCAGD